MHSIKDLLSQTWPWYVAGPVIGLVAPALLLIGNRMLGISGNLRHICAAVLPGNVPFLKYDWKKESWNLLFALGLVLGGFIGGVLLGGPHTENVNPETMAHIRSMGVQDTHGYLPQSLFNWSSLFTLKGFLLMIVGGFLIGFGTRYAGGCTSGHGISGLSDLQWTSLIAVSCFFAGGILTSYYILPFILMHL
jgi:hypothetical protein